MLSNEQFFREEFHKILQLLHVVENIKKEMRHSWLSDGRQESVAEHSWRLALMVMLFAPYLKQAINLEKAIKMAIIHDLAEAYAGDIPVFECTSPEAKQKKQAAEEAAMHAICNILNNEYGTQLHELWLEYEAKQSPEAKFVTALDKIEVFIQHNEAPMSTWLHLEKLMVFQPKWKDKHCEFDEAMATFSQMINEEAIAKLTAAGNDINRLRAEAI